MAQPHTILRALLASLALGAAGCNTTDPVTEPAPPLMTDPAESDDAAKEAEADEATEGESKTLSRTELKREADRILDEWHQAAAVGDRNRYVGHFSPDAVFLGTDASERWDLATFTAYVDEHFKPGSGWAYTPYERYVILGPNEEVAWFDEKLDSAGYGALRGTGALRRDGDTWKIAHYSMTFTIPNDIARDVVDVVRSSGQ